MDAQAPRLIAVYDMDRTITRRATYNGFLAHMALKRAPWRLMFLPLIPFALTLYALKIRDRGWLKSFSQRWLIGRRVARQELAKHIERHADLVLGRNVWPQAQARIAAEKAAGYTHVLATASYRLYVEAIAQRLHFDHVIATDLMETPDGHVLSRLEGANVFDDAKLKRVQDWMAREGIDRDTVFMRAYSDHFSDAPLLAFADEAYAVNPHLKLRRLAGEKGWEVIDWA